MQIAPDAEVSGINQMYNTIEGVGGIRQMLRVCQDQATHQVARVHIQFKIERIPEFACQIKKGILLSIYF